MKMMKCVFIMVALCLSFKAFAATIDNTCSDFYNQDHKFSFSVDALCWQVIETPVWCYTVNGEISQNPQVRNDKSLSFGFRPGFRLNLGYQNPCNDFDIRGSYSFYYTSLKSKETGSWVTPTFLPGRVLLSHDFYDSASINWCIKFNIIDLDIGSTFINSPYLKIRPFIGLKGGWIFQDIDGLWQNPKINGARVVIDDYEKLTNYFYGVGPKIGCCNFWTFIASSKFNVSLSTAFQASYLLGHWKLTDNLTTTQTGVLGASTNLGNRHYGTFVFQANISLSTSYQLADGKYRLKASFGYEVQDWLNQYQVLDDLAGANNLSLILHGFMLNLGVDF
jgi:hypothetical protein